MANKSVESFMVELEDQFKNRRGFLTGATAAIATGAAFQLEPDKSSSLRKWQASYITLSASSQTKISLRMYRSVQTDAPLIWKSNRYGAAQ